MSKLLQGTCAVADAVELATVTRGDFVESRHAGSALVLSASGETIVSLGDTRAIVLARSTMKPIQLVAMQLLGLRFASARECAVSMASHSGTREHVELVRAVLGDVPESALACPAQYPMDTETRHAMIRAGEEPQRIHMCCSGKHAAMLRTCQQMGWPLEGYTDPEHELQKCVFDTVQRMCVERPLVVTVDGCGAPVYGLSLAAIARGYRRLATSDVDSPFRLNRVAAATFSAGVQHPELIEGPGQGDTLVMETTGFFAKYGAEGLSVIAAPDGTVAAVKVLDGSLRPARAIALSLLTYVGALPKSTLAQTLSKLNLRINGGEETVGEIRVSIPALASA